MVERLVILWKRKKARKDMSEGYHTSARITENGFGFRRLDEMGMVATRIVSRRRKNEWVAG